MSRERNFYNGEPETLAAHLSGSLVKKGDDVDTGQEIGKAGSIGMSTGDALHIDVYTDGICTSSSKMVCTDALHLEVYIDGTGVDPSEYLGLDRAVFLEAAIPLCRTNLLIYIFSLDFHAEKWYNQRKRRLYADFGLIQAFCGFLR